ncbi:MAG: methyltransferase domain-containing protein [Acidobacteriota bacterium]
MSRRRLFDRLAPEYDRHGPRFFERFARHLASALEVAPGLDVLDVATGAGAVTRALVDGGAEEERAVGVDLSVGMLRRAMGRGRGPGPLVARARAEALPFASGSFDRVACGFAVNLFDDPPSALAEARRLLRADGLLALTTWSARCPYFLWLSRALEAYRRGDSGPIPPPLVGEVGAGRDRELEELRDSLGDANFDGVEWRLVREPVAYVEVETWWRSLWSHCFRPPLEALPSAELPVFREAFEARFRAASDDRGVLHVDLEAWLVTARPGRAVA